MLTIDGLKEYGANVEEGLARCINNEAFYLRLIKMAYADAGFDQLAAAVSANDKDAAFEAAHALKGVLGNLSLTPIYEPVAEITELLRNRQEADYAVYVDRILEQRDKLKAMAED